MRTRRSVGTRSCWHRWPGRRRSLVGRRRAPTSGQAQASRPLKACDGNSRRREGRQRRLHDLPHQDRRGHDASVGHGDARLRDVPRRRSRRCRSPPAWLRTRRSTAPRSGRRTRSRASRTCGSRRQTPSAPTPQWLRGVAGVHPVRQPRRSSRRRPDLRQRATPAEVRNVRTSMMTTGAMLWQAALYNNGGAPYKNARYGESYAPDGTPQTAAGLSGADARRKRRTKGWLPFLEPLPRWEVTQPGNVLRVVRARRHEEGGDRQPDEAGRTRPSGRRS